jgi:hypothetical protein
MNTTSFHCHTYCSGWRVITAGERKPEPSHRKVMLQAQPSEGRKDDTPLGYLGQIVLRREQSGILFHARTVTLKHVPMITQQ